MLKAGNKGIKVTELQSDLNKAGFSPGAADGIFGPATERAVKAFQQANGLVVDGIVGPATQAALTGKVNVRPRPAQMERDLSENFKEKEFACRHCGQIHVEPELIRKMQALRNELGKVVTVTSGYRCPTHNRNVGGASQSRHMQGQAADLVVAGVSPAQVAQVAERVGFGGVGRYSNFTHVDIGPTRRWNG